MGRDAEDVASTRFDQGKFVARVGLIRVVRSPA
jgi:hypothetical protein